MVALPDVCELDANEADEFVVLATDGLWCATLPDATPAGGGRPACTRAQPVQCFKHQPG